MQFWTPAAATARSCGWTRDPQSSGRVGDLLIVEPQECLQPRVDEELVGLEVPVPHADGACGGRQGVALLTLMQLFLAIAERALGFSAPTLLDQEARNQDRLSEHHTAGDEDCPLVPFPEADLRVLPRVVREVSSGHA